MTPYDFIQTWSPRGSRDGENERQGAQAYFIDLCELLNVPKPGITQAEDSYIFEKLTLALGHTPTHVRGFADVFYKDRFAWENKAPQQKSRCRAAPALGLQPRARQPVLAGGV